MKTLHVTVHFIIPWVETKSTPPEIHGRVRGWGMRMGYDGMV